MEVLEDRLPKFFKGVVELHNQMTDKQEAIKNRKRNMIPNHSEKIKEYCILNLTEQVINYTKSL
jgi:hypothetical protein